MVVACSGPGSSGRYSAEAFRTTRTNFVYVRDRVTGQWVNRHCELRVSVERPLPIPEPDGGDAISVQYFEPGIAQTGGLRSAAFTTRDRYRIWIIADVLNRADTKGRSSYSVQLAWRQRGAETRFDPLELFHLPPLGDMPPNVWSPWVRASATREGAFAWWDETYGKPPDPPQ